MWHRPAHRSFPALCHRPSGTDPSTGITSTSSTRSLTTAAPDEEVEQSRHLAATAERSAQDAIDDVLTSAGRVESALTEVATLVQQSDGVRRELYGKYRADHQFHGYRGSRNTKGLIVALSQG